MRRLAALWGLVVLSAPGQSAADEDALAELDAAHRLWQSAGIVDYRYSYQKYCECYRGEPPVTVVTVQDGQITRVFHRHSDSEREVPARDGSLSLYWTVDDLLDKLANAYSEQAIVRVEYDVSLGYPTEIFIDYDPSFSGDETDLRLKDLERL